MKGFLIQQQAQNFVEENMSNITSVASGEASFSSSNRNDTSIYFTPQSQPQPQQIKKKRNQPGNPDPEAEVIALSPKSLLATNRFVCEICSKGFQRDQNLQLHRRGHNLPWKLKKRNNNEVIRKKVYICPEPSCVHHDPSRALGDLTGIKKHFCRKHGEKKWKCEKCAKRYAVQSDWKAHSKTCGTKEYRCECGTIFSRRDSFITHRAFCDALAAESGKSSAILSGNPSLPMNLQFQTPGGHYFNIHQNQLPSSTIFPMKKEQPSDIFNLKHEIPPWLMPSQPLPADHHHLITTSSMFHENPNPSLGRAQQGHVSATDTAASKQRTSEQNQFGLNLSSREELTSTSGLIMNSLASYGNKAATVPSGMMMTGFSFADDGFEGSTFEDAFGGFTTNATLNSKNGNSEQDMMTTKDFLGLRHTDIFNLAAGLVNTTTTTTPNHEHAHHHHQFQNHKTWES